MQTKMNKHWQFMLSLLAVLALTLACGKSQDIPEQPAPAGNPAPANPAQSNPVQAPMGGVILFQDDFQDGQPQDWTINSAWDIQQNGDVYLFSAFDQGGAFVTQGGGWKDYTFQTNFQVTTGDILLSINLSKQGRYGLRLGADGVYLLKEQPSGNFTVLAEAGPVTASDWHSLTFASQNGHLQASIDQTLWFDYVDSSPMAQGTIAVTALAGSQVSVDDVLVTRIQGTLVAGVPQAPPPLAGAPSAEQVIQESSASQPAGEVETEDDTPPDGGGGGQPDLVVTGVEFDPDPVLQGQQFTASYSFTNQGTGTSGPFTFRLHFHASAGIADCNMDVDALAPGQAAWGGCVRQINGNTGNYPFEATVDVEGEIAESNENNNLLNQSLQVAITDSGGESGSDSGQPDLVLTGIQFDPDPAIQGQRFTVSYGVRNQGAGTSGAFTLRLHFHASAGVPDCNMDVNSLAPGQEAWGGCVQQINGNTGNYPVKLTADVEGEIAESNEGNNVLDQTLRVAITDSGGESGSDSAGQPDLVATGIQFDPNPPVQGQQFTVSYGVRNQGTGASAPFTLRLHFHDAAGAADCNMDVGALAPGQEAWGGCVRQINGNPGNYPVKLTADVEGEITESNEGNNVANVTLVLAAH